MRLRIIAATTALLACSLAAKADTYRLFNLSGTFSNGATLSGQVDLDLNSNLQTDTSPFASTADFTLTSGGNVLSFIGNNRGIGQAAPFSDVDFFSGNDQITLRFLTATPGAYAGYAGGSLNTGSTLVISSSGTVAIYFLTSGALTQAGPTGPTGSTGSGFPTSVTPEPSSLALLGTGVIGIIGAARRRFIR